MNALVLSSLASCLLSGGPRAQIADVRTSERLVLHKPAGTGSVSGLTVKGSGHIDGTARIQLLVDGQPYKSEALSGEISFEWKGDWYSDDATVVYTPTQVQSGSLTLDYRFHAP